MSEIRDTADEIENWISDHNRGHANSNSPYGHECGKRCIAEAFAVWHNNKTRDLRLEADLLVRHAKAQAASRSIVVKGNW